MPQALDHDPPPESKLVPFGVLMLGTGLLTLIFGCHECSDFLGRLHEGVVDECPIAVSWDSSIGDLSGQWPEEFRRDS